MAAAAAGAAGAPTMVSGSFMPRKPCSCGAASAPAPVVSALLVIFRSSATATSPRVQRNSNTPPSLRFLLAASIMRFRPNWPGSLNNSTVRPSKVTALMRAPDGPCVPGWTMFVHCAGVLR